MSRREMKEQSATSRSTFSGNRSGVAWRRLTRSRLTTRGSLVSFQCSCPWPYVHGVNPGGTVLQQAVREAAGGRPGVQGDKAAHVQGEMLQGREQLVASPRDEPLRLLDLQLGVTGDLLSGLGDRDFAVALKQADIPGHDQPLGLLAALDQSLCGQDHVRAFHFLGHAFTSGRPVPRR
jgi:hypothetical protein